MKRGFLSLSLSVGLCLLAVPVSAQAVQGRLVDALGSIPVAGAFIVLLDSSGTEVERTMTGSDGGYRLSAPGAGVYQLRSERIGFRAGLSESFTLEEGAVYELDMQVDAIVIQLDTITISDDAKRCRVVGEQGLETATVWEEARKALASIAWSDSAQQLTYEVRNFRNEYEHNGRPLVESARKVRRNRVMPYSRANAAQLQSNGYVIEDVSEYEPADTIEDSSEYEAPDAEVFFSEPFLENHCFKLERDGDYEGLVGLAFEPTGGNDVPEVKGTLWLSEATSELRWMEIQYTNLRSTLRERHARARLDFSQLTNGMWIVRRWQIRMPIVERHRPGAAGATRRREMLYGFVEDGSEVMRVLSRSGEVLFESASEPNE